jgi:hypothetical protein
LQLSQELIVVEHLHHQNMQRDACDPVPEFHSNRKLEDVESSAKFNTKRKLEDIDASNANEMFPGPFCFTPIVVFEETPTKPIKKKKKYMCTFQGCSKEFAYPHTRDRHQQTHNGEKSCKCSVEGCSSAFSRPDMLTRHERTHSGEKNHKCSFDGCNKAFTQSGHRDEHVKYRHWDRESAKYKEWNGKLKAAFKLRYHSDAELRAAQLCRGRLWYMLKSQGGKKTGHTHELIGCTWAELVAHLNDNIFGYRVGDKGLHIDHIRPCASFQLADNPVEQRKCMNFNNLQLMPAEENLSKSDFYDPEAYAEMPSGKAIAVLSVGWEKQFPADVENDVDFDSDSEWEEDFEEEVEYEYEMEMEF